MKLLFESDPAVIASGGLLRFVQNRPRIHPEPLVRPDCPIDRGGVSAYGTVLHDGGRFRMWYQAIPDKWSFAADITFVACAESEDGIHWTKPSLNLVDCGNGPNNLCDLQFHCPSLFIDPHAPPGHRYRATGHVRGNAYPQASSRWGYYTAHSADGLRWTLDQTDPQWPGGDVLTSIYHPARDCGLISLKHTPRLNGIQRRSIRTAEFRNGQFGPSVSALYPDEFDDVCAAQRGFRSADYYGMGMMPAGMGTVGFLWKYWHELPYTPSFGTPQGIYGASDIALVYQPDPGGKWFHIPGRPDFISHSELPWSSGWIYSSSTVVDVGEEQRLYYSGVPYAHAYPLDERWKANPKWAQWIHDHPVGGITFASWPRNRLFGLESPREGWLTLDLGVRSEPVELFLNYTTRYDGCVRAEVVERPEYSLEQGVALTGDSLGAPLAWAGGTRITALPNQPLKVKLHLENATVYAYDVRTV